MTTEETPKKPDSMSEDEWLMRQRGARVFAAVEQILEGLDEHERMYILINLVGSFVLEREAKNGAEGIARLAQSIFLEIQEAILSNIANDPEHPMVKTLLEASKPQ